MMATTHAVAGLLVGALVTAAVPEVGLTAMLAGFAGGLFPDLDLYAGHRETLHFPVYYSAAAAPAVVAAALAPGAVTVGVALFLVAAALHSASDALGGGLEARPWEATSDHGVYDHFNGRWVPPRRYVRYDGAPEDLLVCTLLAVPGFAMGGPLVSRLLLAALGVSAVYTVLRRPLADLAEQLPAWVPPDLRLYVPERFLDGE